ncbi:MAG: hypothetical protein Q7J30_02815 [Candidatus Azambacteria bacterium]|nr:hypothetical protein [Candidatus Azambacteria bacterium]
MALEHLEKIMDDEIKTKIYSLWERINKREQEILDYRENPSEKEKGRIQSDLNSTKKFFNQNSGKLSNDSQDKFRNLFKILQNGLSLENDFSEFRTLKDEFKKDIDIMMKDYGEKEKINPPHIFGDYVAGDKIGRDKNNNIPKEDVPLWLKWVALIVGIIGVIWAIYTYFFPNKPIWGIDIFRTEESINVATTTPNISDLFNKALSYDTVAERQDFLGKYVNALIYGDGVIKEISRSGERFLLDITTSGQLLICPQEKTDNLEKRFYFLKGKDVRFYGTFTYSTYFGSNGLVIDNCSFEIK